MLIALDQLREKPHLSVSSLKTWLSCPRKFFFRYVQKAVPSQKSISLIFGSCWHELLGYLLLAHQRGRQPPRQELNDYFASTLEQELQSDGPPVLFEDNENVPKLVTTAMNMLDAFRLNVALPEQLLHVELPFSLELFDPATGEVGLMPLIGAIDVVVGKPGGIELWELKSGKRRWPEDAVLYDFQPTAYRMATRAMKGASADAQRVHLKLIVTTKTERPDVQVEDLVRTAADERDLLETAASIQRAVQSGCFHPVRSWMCKQCEFAEVCT